MSKYVDEMRAIPCGERNKVITQPFLDNLQRLGMYVPSYCVADEMVHLDFNHVYPAVRFMETILTYVDPEQYFYVEGNSISFIQYDLPKIKREIAKLVKEKGLKGTQPDEIEDVTMEVTETLNKLAVLVLGYMGFSMEQVHCCDNSLAASVSPENKGNLDLMFFIIQQLLPRELGGIKMSFTNSSSTLELKVD